jgi:hypothetical protein
MEGVILKALPMRVWAAVLVTAAFSASACRAVIGYRSLTYDAVPDAGPDSTLPDGAVDARVADAKGHDGKAQDARSPDAKLPDGGAWDGSCPAVSPTVLFTSSTPLLGPLFLSGAGVYAQISAGCQLSEWCSLYCGLVGCPKTGCNGDAEVLQTCSSAGLPVFTAWGSAAANDAGLFRSLYTNVSVPDGGDPSDATMGEIESTDPDGGDLKVVATGLGYPYFMVATSKYVYWVDDPFDLQDNSYNTASWSVRAAQVGGATKASSLLMPGRVGEAFGVFSDQKNMYVVASDNPLANNSWGVFSCPLDCAGTDGGCSGSELISGVTSAWPAGLSFAADGQYLYKAEGPAGKISRLPLDKSTGEATFVTDQLSPSNIMVGATDVFWSTEDGEIFRIPKDGSGTYSPLVCGLSAVTSLAVDSERVYFIATDDTGNQEVAYVPLP